MPTVTLTQVGNSLGVILPEDALVRLRLGENDKVFLADTPDGLLLTPYNPLLREQLTAGREFMREFRNTFRTLSR